MQTNSMAKVSTETVNGTVDHEHPRELIPELLKLFYHMDWVTGTGGGISIKHGDKIYIAPSGVQKERVQPEDLFVTSESGDILESPPPSKNLRMSECTPLFMLAYTLRDDGFHVVRSNTFWTELFVQYFVEPETSDNDHRDDMLFYVRKLPTDDNKAGTIQVKTSIEVYRKIDYKKLPSMCDVTIDWEETVYLNIILHQFEYKVTCAICTRTGERELEIIKKHTQKVYPSPSKRSMDGKGTSEEITYPYLYFTVDNFEEAFSDIVVKDSELFCVELVATDRHDNLQGVVFLGSVRYEAVKKVYDNRNSLKSRIALNMSLGWFKSHKRVEFLKMRGPHGKGHAEIAVSRKQGSGAETPDLENFPIEDFGTEYLSRRTSDPSVSPGVPKYRLRKSRSDMEKVDMPKDSLNEVEATSIREELCAPEYYNGFWHKSFGQAWHWFREKRRASSPWMHCYLTYISLPWHRIIADVLDIRQTPVLTF